MTTLSHVPLEERPRERLLERGTRSVSDAELVAILIRSGSRRASAVELARGLIEGCGGLPGLARADASALRRSGLGAATSAAVLAAVEIGRRVARAELPLEDPLREPAVVARYLTLRYGRTDQEIMGALFLDSRHRLIAESELFRGTLARASVEPRPILKEGLLRGAAALLLFHTHPSGDPTPSAEDLAFTRRMAEAGEVVGIRLLDHLILGSASRFTSLRQRGAW
ncbi:MAG TPA: DNA repair protein RadC [Planctomycetota bacterium]|nr:DNA repair protein RadC [Planctomycetota bacterium]